MTNNSLIRTTPRLVGALIRLAILMIVAGYFLLLIGYFAARAIIGDNFWLLGWVNNFATYYFLPCLITLPIVILLRSKSLALVNIALLLGFAVWAIPRMLPDIHLTPTASAQTSTSSLKVIAFNVLGNNLRRDDVAAWLNDSQADLIVLEEVPPRWEGVSIPSLSQAYPYQFISRAWGNAVLSRYPIVDTQLYDLAEGFLGHFRVQIDLNGTIIAVYPIHTVMPQREQVRLRLPGRLQNPFVNMLLKYDDSWRNRQIDTLLSLLDGETHPFIVAGDFNLSADSVKYADMAGRLKDSFDSAGVGIGATSPVAAIAGLPSFVPPMIRIDYIWHDGSFDVLNATVGQPLGSDHLPVIATLALKQAVG